MSVLSLPRAARPRRLAWAGLLAVVALAACTAPNDGAAARLDVRTSGLPDGVAPVVEVVAPDGSVTTLDAAQSRLDLPAGTVTVVAHEVEAEDGARFLPDPAQRDVVLTYGGSETLDVAYTPACVEGDLAACGALSGYPQGTLRTEGPWLLSGGVDRLGDDGARLERASVATTSVTDRAFTLALPRRLEAPDLLRIGTVVEGFTFGQAQCDASDVAISDPRVRANDLVLEASTTDDDNETTRLGEVYLYEEALDRMVVWLYADGAVDVTGRESCGASSDADGRELTFDLSLEAGWNLVAFGFEDTPAGGTRTHVTRIDGPVGRAFALMRGDDDDEFLGDVPHVAADTVRALAMHGHLALPRTPDGDVEAPWSRPLRLQPSLAGDVDAGTLPEGVGDLVAVTADDAYGFDFALPDDPAPTDGQLRTFATNGTTSSPLDPDHTPQAVCDREIATSIPSPTYLPAMLDVYADTDQGDPLYRGNAHLTHGPVSVAWWYVPRAFSVATDAPQNCRYTTGALTSTTYDLDLRAGWNPVFHVAKPRPTSGPADDAAVADVLWTTDAGHADVSGADLYWRVEANERALDAIEREGARDGGSTPTTVRPRFFACGPDADCPLNVLHDHEVRLAVRVEGSEADLPDPLVAPLTRRGYDVELPSRVEATSVTSRSDTLLPPARHYTEGVRSGAFEACDGRTGADGGVAFFTTLALVTDDAGGDAPVRIGQADLHREDDDAAHRHAVTWAYVGTSRTVAWRNDACFLRSGAPDAFDRDRARPVRFDVDLRLRRGWNVVVRSTRTDDGPYGAQEHVWRVADADGAVDLAGERWNVFDDFRWYANLTDRVPDDPDVAARSASHRTVAGTPPLWADVLDLRRP